MELLNTMEHILKTKLTDEQKKILKAIRIEQRLLADIREAKKTS